MKYKARSDASGKTLLRVPAGRYAVSASTLRGLQRSELVVEQERADRWTSACRP
ncbi:MAG: hypothetical protein U1G05_15760 [Kiritimatiellia bacterium]